MWKCSFLNCPNSCLNIYKSRACRCSDLTYSSVSFNWVFLLCLFIFTHEKKQMQAAHLGTRPSFYLNSQLCDFSRITQTRRQITALLRFNRLIIKCRNVGQRIPALVHSYVVHVVVKETQCNSQKYLLLLLLLLLWLLFILCFFILEKMWRNNKLRVALNKKRTCCVDVIYIW